MGFKRFGCACLVKIGLSRECSRLDAQLSFVEQAVGNIPKFRQPSGVDQQHQRLAEPTRQLVDRLLSERLRLDDINAAFDRLAAGESIRQVVEID